MFDVQLHVVTRKLKLSVYCDLLFHSVTNNSVVTLLSQFLELRRSLNKLSKIGSSKKPAAKSQENCLKNPAVYWYFYSIMQ